MKKVMKSILCFVMIFLIIAFIVVQPEVAKASGAIVVAPLILPYIKALLLMLFALIGLEFVSSQEADIFADLLIEQFGWEYWLDVFTNGDGIIATTPQEAMTTEQVEYFEQYIFWYKGGQQGEPPEEPPNNDIPPWVRNGVILGLTPWALWEMTKVILGSNGNNTTNEDIEEMLIDGNEIAASSLYQGMSTDGHQIALTNGMIPIVEVSGDFRYPSALESMWENGIERFNYNQENGDIFRWQTNDNTSEKLQRMRISTNDLVFRDIPNDGALTVPLSKQANYIHYHIPPTLQFMSSGSWQRITLSESRMLIAKRTDVQNAHFLVYIRRNKEDLLSLGNWFSLHSTPYHWNVVWQQISGANQPIQSEVQAQVKARDYNNPSRHGYSWCPYCEEYTYGQCCENEQTIIRTNTMTKEEIDEATNTGTWSENIIQTQTDTGTDPGTGTGTDPGTGTGTGPGTKPETGIETGTGTTGKPSNEHNTSSGSVFAFFPFCIPVDIYYFISAINVGGMEAPVIDLDIFKTLRTEKGIEYEPWQVDFSEDKYTAIVFIIRYGLLLLFLVGLFKGTKRFIWTGGG